MKTVAVILAAGSGKRLGCDSPKAFVPLAGRPLLDYSISAFAACGLVDQIVVVLPPDRPAAGLHPAVALAVPGGERRSDSSRNGVMACPADTGSVLIHDAARPFIDRELIRRVLAGLELFQAVAPALPATDSLSLAAGGVVSGMLRRERVFCHQTPQAFRCADLRKALAGAEAGHGDDLGLAFAAGLSCGLVAGDARNIKITYSSDLEYAEFLIARSAGH